MWLSGTSIVAPLPRGRSHNRGACPPGSRFHHTSRYRPLPLWPAFRWRDRFPPATRGPLQGLGPCRVTTWLLGRVTPAFEVLPDRPHNQVDGELLFDQVAHSTPRPQGGSNAQIFRTILVKQLLDVAGLFVAEDATRAFGASSPLMREGLDATRSVSRPPAADGFPTDPEYVCDLALGKTQLTTAASASRSTSTASSDNWRASGNVMAIAAISFPFLSPWHSLVRHRL